MIFILCLVTLSGCENGQPGHAADSVSSAGGTSNTVADISRVADSIAYTCGSKEASIDGQQLTSGQELVRTSAGDNVSGYYRQFICMSPQGNFLVQDFFSTGEKRTQVYAITSPQALFSDAFDIAPNSRIDGLYVQWHVNGQKALEVNFEHNAMQGTFEQWDENGVRVFEQQMQNGLQHGQGRVWYASNGQLMLQNAYIQGKLDGRFEEWYENGQAMRLAQYANGAENDEQLIWWENGQKRSQGHFSSGKKHGVWQSWWPNGVLRSEGRYVVGRRDGLWTWWDEQGIKRAQGHYHSGSRVGNWQYWDAQGQPQGHERMPLIVPNESQQARILQNKYGIRLAAADNMQGVSDQAFAMQLEPGQTWYLNVESDLGVLSEQGTQSDAFIRRYIGRTTQGGWIVQDFYTDGERTFSYPFVLTEQSDMRKQFASADSVLQSSIEGLYVMLHPNGHKALEARMRNGEPAGHWKVWDAAGQITDQHRYGR